MSAPSFAGAPLSRALIATTVVTSVLAAITSTQQYLAVPLVPHLSRDHQFFRLVGHHFAFSNSSELFLAVLVLWYASPGVERMWGSRKYASFLLVTTALSTVISTLLLVFGWRVTGGRFNVLPSGPFAITFAIVAQNHRLIPTLYHFQLFHPSFSLTNRFPLYLLSLLLSTSQPPVSLLLAVIGLTSSLAYTSNFLAMRDYRLSPRLYAALARPGKRIFGDPAKWKVKRGTTVTPEEAMLTALVGASGSVGAGAAGGSFDLAALRGAAQRRTSVQAGGAGAEPTAPANGEELVEEREADEGVAASPISPASPARPTAEAAAAPPVVTADRPMPRIPGTSFLRQWQAGLTGAAEAPSAAQIAELTAIFPHHTRPAIIAALQENDYSTSRAAEALLLAGS
ncbi:hypothetical protein JCM8097_001304 [Rhodosporidiobolus ruineniae]